MPARATRGLTLREIIEQMLEPAGWSTSTAPRRKAQDRIENLEELVNAAEAFVTQEGFGKDAVALPVDEHAPADRRSQAGLPARLPAPVDLRRTPKPARSSRRWRPS
jgi:DNA helicase-2/ATP-dependent DNA helicase PcrA